MADEGGKKSSAVVAFVSVGIFVLIGLPLWWNTTKVYRATLPYAEIEQLSNVKLSAEVILSIILVKDETRQQLLADLLSTMLNNSSDKLGDPVKFNYIVHVRQSDESENLILDSLVNNDTLDVLDDHLQELWNSGITNNETNVYKFILLPKQSHFSVLSHYMQCFVGSYHCAIVLFGDDLQHIADTIVQVTRNVFIQEKAVKDGFSQHIQTKKKQDSMEQMRDLKSTTGFHLSFSLINDEPETGILTWNIKEAISNTLQPLVNKISHFDISVDSQILYYSGVTLHPKSDGGVNYLTTEDLPHMINPIEAKLGSFVSFNPSLNFIVFVPPKRQTPLKIRNDDGVYSSTNAFLSPRWGGVVVHNVYNRKEVAKSTPETILVDVRPLMDVFLSQIRLLIGIKPVVSESGVTVTSFLNSGARDWEVDNLMLVKTMEYLSSSIKTLTSLTQLIDKVRNMVIADSIKVEIEQAVDSIKQCQYEISHGKIVQAFLSSKKAIQSSEKAFFDPSVLELLYFPDDQKFAIYIPLFLPISLPLLVSLFAAIKWLRSKENKESNSGSQENKESNSGSQETDKKTQ